MDSLENKTIDQTIQETNNAESLNKLLQSLIEASINNKRDAGTRFETLTKDFLRNDATYKNSFTEVYTYKEFVDTLQAKDDPRAPKNARDIGIDLVAKNAYDDYYTAIQCKFYAENNTITKGEVDSFISASSNQELYNARLIVTTSDKPWSNNVETELETIKPAIQVIKRGDLIQSSINWEEYLHGHLAQQKKFNPLPFQKDAIDAVEQGFKTSDRGKLIMACGTGKTFTSLKIAERITPPHDSLILLLVPSLSLLSQTLTSWTKQSHRNITAFAVCSDSSTGKGNLEELESLTRQNELAYPATTNAHQLAKKIKQAQSKNSDLIVVFSTYQSSEVIAEAQKLGMPDFDLIICDEAHRTASGKHIDEKQSAFTLVHDNEKIRGKKRLYMTATPKIFDADSKSQQDFVLYSMDDEAIFGKTFYTINFTEAVYLNKLVDYKVIVLGVDPSLIGEDYATRVASEGGLPVEHASKIIGAWKALAKSGLEGEQALGTDKLPMKRAVGFAQVIDSTENQDRVASKAFTDNFNAIIEEYKSNAEKVHGQSDDPEDIAYLESLPTLNIETKHIDGSMCATEKDGLLNWLKEEPDDETCKILFNVRCLSEGVDVPSLDAVIFLSPRKSQVDVVQTVGRVMRTAPNKKRGYVIIPIVTTSNLDASLFLDNNKQFDVVWQTLNALKSIDADFGGVVDGTNQTLNKEKIEVICLSKAPQKRTTESNTNGASKAKTITRRKRNTKVTNDNKKAFQTILHLGRDPVIEEAIKARIVKKVGNRREWEDWAKDVGEICQNQIKQIEKVLDNPSNPEMHQAFAEFSNELKATLNGDIGRDEIIEMLGQHIIIKPILDALFKDYPFTEKNAIARAMTDMVKKLDKEGMATVNKTLDNFYKSVEARSKTLENSEQRQRVIVELFDKFFKVAFPKMQEKLGIVYTPVEVVDFINRSVCDVLKTEFNMSIEDEDVDILDPFTGTGTFITRLISSDLIPVDKLTMKYKKDLHAHELVPLSYYIASMNIEATYHEVMKAHGLDIPYEPNEIVCWTDTFADINNNQLPTFKSALKENADRLLRERAESIEVIIGNPPYSSGQESQNDNNQNDHYDFLDARIANTYAANSIAVNKNSLYDSYIRGYRWASDIITDKGVIAFVTNAGWIESNSADGMRKCLQEEFNSIYIYHLKGNQRTSGEQSRKEGGKIFGAGSRAPIAIVILIKNKDKKANGELGKIYFHSVDDYLTREEKLAQVSQAGSYLNLSWSEITPDKHNDWLNQRDDSYSHFIRLDGKKALSKEKFLFTNYSNGVKTNRDSWTYNSSKSVIEESMSRCINNFNKEVIDVTTMGREPNFDTKLLSWDRPQKRDVQKGNFSDPFKQDKIYPSLYRPFYKQSLYFDRYWNNCVYQMPAIFPTSTTENLVIGVTGIGNKAFSCLMSASVSDLQVLFNSQWFPRYIYDNPNGNSSQPSMFKAEESGRKDGITPEGLKHFQATYGDDITVDDVFFYIYGILHSKDYLKRYANNLSKELPRIPRVATRESFEAFSQAGRKLAQLHVHFEEVEEFKDVTIKMKNENYRVLQMKWGKIPGKTGNAGKDKTKLIYNSDITVENVPLEAQEYVVNGKSALDWVVERACIKTDKASGIVNNFNDFAKEKGDPRYPLSLFLKVITVSIETMKIVNNLPPLEIHPLDQQ